MRSLRSSGSAGGVVRPAGRAALSRKHCKEMGVGGLLRGQFDMFRREIGGIGWPDVPACHEEHDDDDDQAAQSEKS